MSESLPQSKFTLRVTITDGKYTVLQDKAGNLTALRYGEPWRDCCGDGLIYQLAATIQTLREESSKLMDECEKAISCYDSGHPSSGPHAISILKQAVYEAKQNGIHGNEEGPQE